MIAVFSGFILPDDPIIKSIGFAFAVGILIDAFLVRMTLIPALMSLLGARAWWLPRWLDRLVPNVDIEGAALADKGWPRLGWLAGRAARLTPRSAGPPRASRAPRAPRPAPSGRAVRRRAAGARARAPGR